MQNEAAFADTTRKMRIHDWRQTSGWKWWHQFDTLDYNQVRSLVEFIEARADY